MKFKHTNVVGTYLFWCPGCQEVHQVLAKQPGTASPHWDFNGDVDKPTISPSLLVRSGHFVPGNENGKKGCWCTYNAEHPDKPAPFKCKQCHSFIRDGMIQFLSDCSHELKNQTVPIPEWDMERLF